MRRGPRSLLLERLVVRPRLGGFLCALAFDIGRECRRPFIGPGRNLCLWMFLQGFNQWCHCRQDVGQGATPAVWPEALEERIQNFPRIGCELDKLRGERS